MEMSDAGYRESTFLPPKGNFNQKALRAPLVPFPDGSSIYILTPGLSEFRTDLFTFSNQRNQSTNQLAGYRFREIRLLQSTPHGAEGSRV